jgi:hypothetical protein
MSGHRKGGQRLGKDHAKRYRMVIHENIQVSQILPFVDLPGVVGQSISVITLMTRFLM